MALSQFHFIMSSKPVCFQIKILFIIVNNETRYTNYPCIVSTNYWGRLKSYILLWYTYPFKFILSWSNIQRSRSPSNITYYSRIYFCNSCHRKKYIHSCILGSRVCNLQIIWWKRNLTSFSWWVWLRTHFKSIQENQMLSICAITNFPKGNQNVYVFLCTAIC